MQITSTMIDRLIVMSEQARLETLAFLAEELRKAEAETGRLAVQRGQARERQARYAEKKRAERQPDGHSDDQPHVTMTSASRHDDVRMTGNASRVDNLPSLSENIETVREGRKAPKNIKNPPSEPFASFWSVYPKRAGDRDRKAALKAFNAALKRTGAETIVSGAARYAAHCDETGKTGTEFVRQARTWLNANGWEEPYEISRSITNGSSIRDNWAIADAVLAEQDRREGLCGPGGEDDLLALP